MLAQRKPAHQIVDELAEGTIQELKRLAAMAQRPPAR
jgi:hypothetical protein